MVQLILNKLLYVIFFLSCFVIFRHGFIFISNFIKPEPVKLKYTSKDLVYIAISLSIIITSLIKGIGI
jgi:hypothetical protein